MNCRNIKHSICILIVVSCLISFVCCKSDYNIGNPVLPYGFTDKLEFNDENEYSKTVFCVYYYEDSSAFDNNPNFEKVAGRKETIEKYFQNFISWLEVKDRSDELKYDYSEISPDDYVALSDMAGQKSELDYEYRQFENYNLMLFDVSENTLYNISNYY